MQDVVIDPVVRLVLGVARLGEADLNGWWRSRGLSDAGEYVLGGAIPRTWILTALELDVLSAAIWHDDVLKRPTALHLFSDHAPFKRLALNWLREQKLEGKRNGLADLLRHWDRETARVSLREWIGTLGLSSEALGPGRRLGAIDPGALGDPARRNEVCRWLAAAYLDEGTDLLAPYYDLRA